MNKPIITITRSYEKELREELAKLKGYLSGELAEKIKEARAQGDLSENAEYDAAKDEQGEVAARIKEIESTLAHSQVMDDADISTEKVGIGISVVLYDVEMDEELEFKIVSTKEADISGGKMSDESPIGAAIIGHKVGEEVEVETPSGIEKFKILEIKKEEEEK